MKKILAFIIAALMVLSLFTACDASSKPTEAPTDPTADTDDDSKLGQQLAGKTPEQTYNAIFDSVDKLENYTVNVLTTSVVDVSGETVESKNGAEYQKTGDAMYCKYNHYSGMTEELWYVDGYMYYSGKHNKEKSRATADAFKAYYFLSVANAVIELESSAFAKKNFVTDGEIYLLRFEFTPEEYKALTGEVVKDNAKYTVCFDANGLFKNLKIEVNLNTQGGYVVKEERVLELNKVGTTQQITAPLDDETFREAPSFDSLDMSDVEDIDGAQVSDSATDYIMIDVADYGRILIRLFPNVAPKTVEAISSHVLAGKYDGTVFHRIVPEFVIQGGNTNTEGAEGIFGEFAANGFTNNLAHKCGVVSMARATPYNSGYDQFFIMLDDNAGLDGGYAAFGYVVYGMSIVDRIAAVETENEKPVEDVVITSVDFVTLP